MLKSSKQQHTAPNSGKTLLRKPQDKDGAEIHRLISECPPLDRNSMYANLLQCTHFSDSCVLAEKNDRAIAFLSAYRLPDEPETMFIWQVAVHAEARGQGLGKKMIKELLERPESEGVKRLQTTITRDNKASWGLFTSFAESNGAKYHDEVLFCRKEHFSGRHASEHLLTISPL